jgi:hypothetical protein
MPRNRLNGCWCSCLGVEALGALPRARRHSAVATTGVADPGYSFLNTRDEPTSREEIRKAFAPEKDQPD